MNSASVLQTKVASPIIRDARNGAIFGWISAIAWIVLGIDSILRPIQDNLRDVYWWLPCGFMMLTIISVHLVQGAPHLRWERFAFWIVMVSWTLVIIGNFGLVFNIPAVKSLGFPGGAVVGTLGLIVFGVGTWQAKVLPRYAALALILWEPGSILTGLLLAPVSPLRDRGSYSAGIWKGAAIAAIAFGLQSLMKSRTIQGK